MLTKLTKTILAHDTELKVCLFPFSRLCYGRWYSSQKTWESLTPMGKVRFLVPYLIVAVFDYMYPDGWTWRPFGGWLHMSDILPPLLISTISRVPLSSSPVMLAVSWLDRRSVLTAVTASSRKIKYPLRSFKTTTTYRGILGLIRLRVVWYGRCLTLTFITVNCFFM